MSPSTALQKAMTPFPDKGKSEIVISRKLPQSALVNPSVQIALSPMSEAEFAAFCERAIPEYAAEKVLAGSWVYEEALQRSHDAYNELLPQGLATPNHFLMTIREVSTQENIGVLWLADDSVNFAKSGFVYELYVEEDWRCQGAGKQAMLTLETKARELGIETLRLHVFGQNRVARSLYEKLGYEITDINMAKVLTPPI
jgi:ribosomal protein S18 acetylase RimI-like enzyme